MKALVIPEPGRFEVREVATPEPGPYQALMRVETMALCNATDRKLVEGHFPGMETYPMVLGHENAGIVEKVGEKATCFKVGDRVLGGMVFDFGVPGLVGGWGGFAEYVLVNDHDAMERDGVADAAHGWYDSCIIQNVVPEGIGADEAAVLCTWREVYGGIGDFSIRPGQKVLVYGAGPGRPCGPSRQQARAGAEDGRGRDVRSGGGELPQGDVRRGRGCRRQGADRQCGHSDDQARRHDRSLRRHLAADASP